MEYMICSTLQTMCADGKHYMRYDNYIHRICVFIENTEYQKYIICAGYILNIETMLYAK